MISVDDDFPYQSDDPELQPSQDQTTLPAVDEQVNQDLKILLRLLVGTAIEGSDEFRRRARLWQAETNATELSGIVISLEDETEASRLRYSLLGFLFQAIDAGYKSLSFLDTVSSQAYTIVARMFAPLTKSRLWRPIQERYDFYGETGESIVNSWINTGRREEQVSRALARKQAYEQIIDEAIGYLAQKPEVRELVQQQSVSMAGEVVDEIRERSSEFDSLLEERVNTLLRRRRNV